MRNPAWKLGRFPSFAIILGLVFAAFLVSPPGVSQVEAELVDIGRGTGDVE